MTRVTLSDQSESARQAEIAREVLAIFAAHPATPMSAGYIRHEIGDVSHKELRSMLDQLVRGRVISYVRIGDERHRRYRTYDPRLAFDEDRP